MIAMTRQNARPADPALSADENSILAAAYGILLKRSRRGNLVQEPHAAGELVALRLATREREVFTAIFLDTRHRIIAVEDLFFGTFDCAEVSPREVVRAALRHNAASVIVGHNHPSSQDPEPSAADRALTVRLKQALALLDIRLLDHFVVAGASAPVSLAARGWV